MLALINLSTLPAVEVSRGVAVMPPQAHAWRRFLDALLSALSALPV